MAGRWFIPIAFGVFALLIVGLWMYLGSQDDEVRDEFIALGISSSGPAPVGEPKGEGDDVLESIASPPVDHLHRVDSHSPAQAASDARQRDRFAVAPRRTRRPIPNVTWEDLARRFSPKLDEVSVRLRHTIGRSAIGYYLQGLVASKRGDSDQAIVCFDRCLRKVPRNPVMMAVKASALIELRQHADAATLLSEVVKIRPDFVEARYNYGVVLTRLALYGEATRQFREVVHRDSTHFRAQYNLASLTQRAGQLGEARDAWRAVTELRPDIVGGWYNLGVMSIDLGDDWEALRCFYEVTILDPEDPHGHANLALVYESIGQLDAALESMMQADRLMPCDPIIMRHLADMHRGLADSGGRGARHHLRQIARLEDAIAMMEEDHILSPHPILAGGGDVADEDDE